MNSQILVICPSRGRPHECVKMIDSFNETQTRSTLRLLLDNNDPKLEEYRSLIGRKCSYVIDHPKTITELINGSWEHSAECFKWFSITNDDFVYMTHSWDQKLIDLLDGRIGIAYGNDLLAGVNMPSTSVISREIPEALGWLQMPTLRHLFGDAVWKHIGKEAKCLFYDRDVIIEHCHFYNNKVLKDEIYSKTNSDEMYAIDGMAFSNWQYGQAASDIDKVISLVAHNLYARAISPK